MVFWVTSSTHGVHPPLHSTRLLKCTSPKQEPEYISLGSGGLGEPEVGRYLGSFLGPSGFVSSPLPPAAHENTLPRAAGMSAPTMEQEFPQPFCHCLEGGRAPITAQVQQFFTALSETAPLCPFPPLSYASPSS